MHQIIEEGHATGQSTEETMNRIEDLLQYQAEFSRLMGATIAYGLDQDISIAASTGLIAVENNFKASTFLRAVAWAARAYTAYDTYETYQEGGAEAAAKQPAIDCFTGKATLVALKRSCR